MTLDELIEKLPAIRAELGSGRVPVFLCAHGGSGECDVAVAAANPTTGDPEVWLQEKV
jgi:hypothetical protein